MNYCTLKKLATIFSEAAKKEKDSDKKDTKKDKKKKKGLKPAADAMMKGKSHPWQACYNKMKDKVDSPEAFCAKMKDVHKGTTDWRSTEGLKKNKKKKDDKSKSDDDMLMALDYSKELEKSFLKNNISKSD